jgi:hypothetical protein
MTNQVWPYVLAYICAFDWTQSPSVVEGDQSVYEASLDLINFYRGDPAVFFATLSRFTAHNRWSLCSTVGSPMWWWSFTF